MFFTWYEILFWWVALVIATGLASLIALSFISAFRGGKKFVCVLATLAALSLCVFSVLQIYDRISLNKRMRVEFDAQYFNSKKGDILRNPDFEYDKGGIVSYSENGNLFFSFGVPVEFRVKNPEEVSYILFIERIENQTGSYGNGARAIRVDYLLKLVRVKDWETVSEEMLKGGNPPSSTGLSGKVRGKYSKESLIKEWLIEALNQQYRK